MLKKILLSIVGLLVFIIATGIVTIVVFKSGVDKVSANNEIIMKSENPNGKEALVIYQNSKSEFPKEISNSFATGLNNKGYNVTVNAAGEFLPKMFQNMI